MHGCPREEESTLFCGWIQRPDLEVTGAEGRGAKGKVGHLQAPQQRNEQTD